MAFKLVESAQDHWRLVNAPHLVALVRAGATFINGQLIERPSDEKEASPQQLKDLDPQVLTIAPDADHESLEATAAVLICRAPWWTA